jgi:tetratricopeptide (TPR) repeat protein
MRETIQNDTLRSAFALAALGLLLVATGCAPAVEEVVDAPGLEEIPVTTASEVARELYDEGQYLVDVGRNVKAREKFQAAVAEDPGFTRGHLGQANVSLSFQEFQQCTDRASESLEGASDGERMMVEINQAFLSGDNAMALSLAGALAESYPTSTRAAIVLAGAQTNQNENVAARASYERALALDPTSAGALFGIAANYLFNEPKDFAKAEEGAQKALDAYPGEAKGHEVMGDIKRAQNDLEAALAAYNKESEMDPTIYLGHHKRGHVNSFLGNVEEARAAYTEAIEIAAVENKAGTAVYRAFTAFHAGDVAAGIDELVEVADGVEAMGTPAPQVKGAQNFALNSAVTAALHAGDLDRAAALIERRNANAMAIAEDVGTEDARRLQTVGCHFWDGLLAAYRGDGEDRRASR